jgi:hypothetical protein
MEIRFPFAAWFLEIRWIVPCEVRHRPQTD